MAGAGCRRSLRKALHRTRPYEAIPGSSDKAYRGKHRRPVLDDREELFADNDCQLHCIVAS